MGHTDRILHDIRTKIAPSDETLDAARSRREEVLAAARGFDGALRTYASGSIAHRTANDDTDADCGVVLDRRSHPELGSDGDGVGPDAVMEGVRDLVRDKLKDAHPELKTRLTKRAIEVKFHEPVGSGDGATDPSVDLIVALTRKEKEGLWIPNRDSGGWDASHPECHTKLLTDPPADVRRVRTRAIRLVKAWNKQFSTPALSSFNIEALALEAIIEVVTIGEAVALWFEHSAREVRKGDTRDPARVSPPVKLLLDRHVVVGRLESAAKHMRTALENDDEEEAVTEELALVFPKFVQMPAGDSSKAALAAALRDGNRNFNRAGRHIAAGAVAATPLKTVRSFGDGEVR
jgi:hypothetical protein